MASRMMRWKVAASAIRGRIPPPPPSPSLCPASTTMASMSAPAMGRRSILSPTRTATTASSLFESVRWFLSSSSLVVVDRSGLCGKAAVSTAGGCTRVQGGKSVRGLSLSSSSSSLPSSPSVAASAPEAASVTGMEELRWPEEAGTIVPSSSVGGGNRIYTNGSGIGTDSSMIAANDRCGNVHVSDHFVFPSSPRHFSYPLPIRRSSALPSSPLFIPSSASSSFLSTALLSPRSDVSIGCTTRRFSGGTAGDEKSARVGLGAQGQGGGKGAGVGGMDDEYGEMTSDGSSYIHPGPFVLESGHALQRAELRYMTYGELNDARDNVLVVCHALTGNASLHSWWGDLLGPGHAFDTSRYFVVCANILGSCYGSTGPTSPVIGDEGDHDGIDDDDEKKNGDGTCPRTYGVDFPDVSVRDTVRLQLHMLRDCLNVRSVKCVIGGSFGGMQAVEYAAQAGSVSSPFAADDKSGRAAPFVRSVLPIACGASHTAWQIAISETQRQAIYADPKWNGGRIDPSDPPLSGLSVARQIGMVSYRTAKGYETKFGRKLKVDSHPPYGSNAAWEVKSYLEYQGHKFLSRFDAVTYVKLTEQLDTHDVGRGRGGKAEALSDVRIPALVLGIDSDVLYPLHEQEELAELFPNGELRVITSEAGHDGFLLEQDQVAAYIAEFLAKHD